MIVLGLTAGKAAGTPQQAGCSVLRSPTFTRTYPKANKHYGSVLYGVCVGFVVYLKHLSAGGFGPAGDVETAPAAQGQVGAVFGVGLKGRHGMDGQRA